MKRLARHFAVGLLAIGLILAPPLQSGQKSQPVNTSPSEIYMVDVWDDDFYPYWQATIVQLLQEDGGVRARYSYLASATLPCGEPDIRFREHFTAGARISQMTALDLCGLKPDSINRKAAAKAKKPEPFATLRQAVVVKCGGAERVFEFPQFKMNLASLKRAAPDVISLLNLHNSMYEQAFPLNVARQSGEEPPVISEAGLALLRSGRFDRGFWFGFKGVHPAIPASVGTGVDLTIGSSADTGKFRNVLSAYKRPAIRVAGRQAELISTDAYRLAQYTAPQYSRLALQARIEGRVELELKVNRETGTVQVVKAVTGHPLLQQSAIDAAKKWRFETAPALPASIKAVLEFSLGCNK